MRSLASSGVSDQKEQEIGILSYPTCLLERDCRSRGIARSYAHLAAECHNRRSQLDKLLSACYNNIHKNKRNGG
jgi:hypothetical protein